MEEVDSCCAICFGAVSLEDDPILLCDGCNCATHKKCYDIEVVPEGDWFCDSCASLGLGASQPAVSGNSRPKRRRKVNKSLMFRECALCPNAAWQGGFLETDSDGWVHASCAKYNPNCQVHERKVATTLVPQSFTRVICELCGTNGFLGCIACTGGCGKSFFHVTCAQLRGLSQGYDGKRCPSCAYKAKVAEQRDHFARVLAKYPELEGVVAALNSGQFDRSKFVGGTIPVRDAMRSADFLAAVRALANITGDREPGDIELFLQAVQQYKVNVGQTELQPKVQSYVDKIVPKDFQPDWSILPQAAPLPPGFVDSWLVRIEFPRLLQAVHAVSLSPEQTKLIEAELCEEATKKIHLAWYEECSVKAVVAFLKKTVRADATFSITGDNEDEEPPAKTSSKRKGGSSGRAVKSNKTGQGKQEAVYEDYIRTPSDIFYTLFNPIRKKISDGEYTKYEAIARELEKNAKTEPYLQGKWNKAPYPRRPYEQIYEYAPTPGLYEKAQEGVMKVLETTKKPECEESDACAQPVPFGMELGTFVTDLRCKSRRVGCPRSAVGSKRPCKLGGEVTEANMWGLDCYTRKNLQSVLEVSISMTDTKEQRLFIQKLLMPVVDAQPAHQAHNLVFACRSILSVIGLPNDFVESPIRKKYDYEQADTPKLRDATNMILTNALNESLNIDQVRIACEYILFAVKTWGEESFRVHPKGVGVQCKSTDGLKSGTFVTEYLGELFPPWRWFEKQDAIKNAQRKVNFKPVLPDFYNIMLERHEDDEEGYNCVYIDPIVHGNFASRLSHSCEPNCATVVMVRGGKYVVTVYTLRDIGFGEELTFDYSSVTEDENEFKAATCLCGSINCRGSFLYYAGLGAFASVINEKHTFLHRNGAVFKACADPILREEDHNRLSSHGVKGAVLDGLPEWMKKWTSLLLGYAEYECAELSVRLCKMTHKITGQLLYNELSASLEAKGVLENRKQNIVITLNKLCNFFLTERTHLKANQPNILAGKRLEEIPAPLVVLTELEVCDKIWNNRDSIVATGLDLALGSATEEDFNTLKSWAKMQKKKKLKTRAALNSTLLELRNMFWSMGGGSEHRAHYTSAGDVITWLYYTRNFFTITAYPGVRSAPIGIRNVDIGRDGSVSESVKQGASQRTCENRTSFNVRIDRKEVDGKVSYSLQLPGSRKVPETLFPSGRPRGKLVLPYWVDFDPTTEFVTLSACTPESFNRIQFQFSESGYLSNLTQQDDPVTSDVQGNQSCFVLASPMPGCTAFYVYSPRLEDSPQTPLAEQPKGDYAVTRVVPDIPQAPTNLQGISWVNTGLFYAFDAALPGTTRFTALDHSGFIQEFFCFTEASFTTQVKFSSAESTFEHSAFSPSSKKRAMQEKTYPKSIDPLKVIYSEEKKYQGGFIWGQMSGWFKQTVSAPDASLSAERRGTLSLPDLGSCFKNYNYSYYVKERETVINRILNGPDNMWPTGTHWSFKNRNRLYGSPWLDDAMDPELGLTHKVVADMRHHATHSKPPSIEPTKIEPTKE